MDKQLIRTIITIVVSVLCYKAISWALNNLSAGKAMLVFIIGILTLIALFISNYFNARDDIHESIDSYIKANKEEKNKER